MKRESISYYFKDILFSVFKSLIVTLDVSVCWPFMYEHTYVIFMNRNELIHEKTFMLTLSEFVVTTEVRF